jgi:dTDP-L-rhamnose 4-epimerase
MSQHILITGGAGFIGSHLANELLGHGYRVRVLDNLSVQVHGPGRKRPGYLNSAAELVVGDVRDPDAVRRALEGVDAVYHFVAAVGVGQSMYQIAEYTEVNNVGTAVLLEALIEKPVGRLIVASSMSIYGEGLYRAPDGSTRGGWSGLSPPCARATGRCGTKADSRSSPFPRPRPRNRFWLPSTRSPSTTRSACAS